MDIPPGARPGQILDNKYRVDSVLGRGGMGVVLAATHLELQQRVAIKLLLDPGQVGSDARGRFQREARAASRIRSRHGVRVSDVAELDDGTPYIVMEFLEGEDLESRLRKGPLPIVEAVRFVVEACDVIEEAHSLGIIHRDLKPANLFVTTDRDGNALIKVLDFGISKVAGASGGDPTLTSTGVAMGTYQYMSPEQFKSAHDVDERTDIWALGAVLFELLSGKPVFVGATGFEIFEKVHSPQRPSLLEMRSEIPPQLELLIQRCLMTLPAARPPTIAALKIELVQFLSEPRATSGTAASSEESPQTVGMTQGQAPALGLGMACTAAVNGPGETEVAAHPVARTLEMARVGGTELAPELAAGQLVAGHAVPGTVAMPSSAAQRPRSVSFPAAPPPSRRSKRAPTIPIALAVFGLGGAFWAFSSQTSDEKAVAIASVATVLATLEKSPTAGGSEEYDLTQAQAEQEARDRVGLVVEEKTSAQKPAKSKAGGKPRAKSKPSRVPSRRQAEPVGRVPRLPEAIPNRVDSVVIDPAVKPPVIRPPAQPVVLRPTETSSPVQQPSAAVSPTIVPPTVVPPRPEPVVRAPVVRTATRDDVYDFAYSRGGANMKKARANAFARYWVSHCQRTSFNRFTDDARRNWGRGGQNLSKSEAIKRSILNVAPCMKGWK